MFLDPNIKKMCDETRRNMNDISHAISSDHQQKFISILGNVVKQVDYRLKYHLGNDVDSANLTILRTTSAYARNIVAINFASYNKVIGDMRPDLVSRMDTLIHEVETNFMLIDSTDLTIALTEIPYVVSAAEDFIKAYYNPPKASSFNLTLQRIVERLQRMMSGTKG